MHQLKKILSAFLWLFSLNITAQNLVPNPGFEIFSSCPDNYSQVIRATPWYQPTAGTSDYYNACDTGNMNVPFCGIGYQPSRNGVAHTGLWGLNGFGDGSREYIQVQLLFPLEQDSCYLIEFYCNLDNNVGYCINRLGAYLSTTPASSTGPGSVMSYTPQVNATVFLNDTSGWMRVHGYYTAFGGESYITIGNFNPFSSTDTLYIGGGSYQGAYYMIDDVKVEKISGCDTTGVWESENAFNVILFPNPVNEMITIEFKKYFSGKIKLYETSGRCIKNINIINETSCKILVNDIPSGIYILQIDNEKELISRKISIIH
jgi:hypothetical protein